MAFQTTVDLKEGQMRRSRSIAPRSFVQPSCSLRAGLAHTYARTSHRVCGLKPHTTAETCTTASWKTSRGTTFFLDATALASSHTFSLETLFALWQLNSRSDPPRTLAPATIAGSSGGCLQIVCFSEANHGCALSGACALPGSQ